MMEIDLSTIAKVIFLLDKNFVFDIIKAYCLRIFLFYVSRNELLFWI